MGEYNVKGLYNGYKKNNAEREALDYYATPPAEVTNILRVLGLDFTGKYILEPCAGGGHMVKGIFDYLNESQSICTTIFASDVMKRDTPFCYAINTGPEYDFLSDNYNYGYLPIDYVIMNPPYSTIEPLVMRGLEIARRGLLVLGRLQFLEGKSRYENLLKDNPPSDVYVYVDRIKCFKNGDFTQTESSAQAYAWFYWDKEKPHEHTKLHWLRRI